MPTQAELEQMDKEADEAFAKMNAPQPEPEPEPAEPEPEPEPSPDADDLEGLTPENAEERIKNAQARMHRATQEAAELRRAQQDEQQQLTSLQSEVRRLQQELEKAQAKPPASPDSAPDPETTSLEKLREDYPSLIDPLLGTINALKKQVEVIGGQVGEARNEVKKTVESDRAERIKASRAAHNAKILDQHADAFEVADSDDFQGWLDRQPQMYRRAVEQGTAEDVIDVLTKYKSAVGSARLDKARAAATPATPRARTQPTAKPTFTRAQIAAMSPAEFEKQEAEIDKAYAEGRIR